MKGIKSADLGRRNSGHLYFVGHRVIAVFGSLLIGTSIALGNCLSIARLQSNRRQEQKQNGAVQTTTLATVHLDKMTKFQHQKKSAINATTPPERDLLPKLHTELVRFNIPSEKQTQSKHLNRERKLETDSKRLNNTKELVKWISNKSLNPDFIND